MPLAVTVRPRTACSASLARDRLRELGLRHARAAAHAGLLGALIELLLGVAVGVDAAVGGLRAVARRRPALLRLRVRRALALLRLPVVADLLERVLDGGPRGAVGARLRVVLLLGRVERLGIRALRLGGRLLQRAREIFLPCRHTVPVPAAIEPDARKAGDPSVDPASRFPLPSEGARGQTRRQGRGWRVQPPGSAGTDPTM